MKVIIAGSRDIHDMALVEKAMEDANLPVTEVVSGGAGGVDTLGYHWARLRGLPITSFPADWDKYGPSAGPIRNEQMAKYSDGLVAVWDGYSRGTESMIRLGLKYKLKTIVSMVR